jgi:hypothetical protein
LRRALEEQRTVRKSGENIVVRQVIQPFLLLDVIYGVSNIAGELGQQLHLPFVEKLGFVRVQGDHAHNGAAGDLIEA